MQTEVLAPVLLFSGAQDYAPYLASGCALLWWRMHGADAREYMHALLREAAGLLVERFASGTLAPLAACACMACVRLPDGLQVASRSESAPRDVDAKDIQVLLSFRSQKRGTLVQPLVQPRAKRFTRAKHRSKYSVLKAVNHPMSVL